MRQLLLALLAALSFSLADVQAARADWKDAILGQSYFRTEAEQAAAKGSKSRSSEVRSAERATESRPRATRTARVEPTDEQRLERSRTRRSQPSYEGGSSAGSGLASYYWQPQRVASGGWFNPNAMTAAHKTLPFGTRVRVTNERNGQSVEVTINDRGPFVAGRVIDLSSAAAGAINMKGAGVVPVRMTVLGR